MGKSGLTPAFRFLKLTYGNYIKKRYSITAEGIEDVLPFRGPCIVFANHTHTLDPFFISEVYPYTIRWVAGSYLFKMKGVSFLLRHLVRAIPKVQGRSDLETIRNISRALKEGDIVGLFPEGTRSWDGEMMDITAATAKLVRIFHVPVVFCHIEGGFLNKPRWSDKERRGPVSVRVVKVLTEEEISSLSLPEITEITAKYLSFSTDEWQESAHIPYPSESAAEGSERLFYLCPKCHRFSTMRSGGREVVCSSCGFSATFDDYGRIRTNDDDIPYTKLSEWHEWERKELGEIFDRTEEGSTIFTDSGILFQIPGKKKLETVSEDFTVTVTKEGFVFIFSSPIPHEGKSVERLFFPFSSIESVVINAKQTIEFYADGKQYRFRTALDRSALKYQEIYLHVKAKG